MGWRPKAGLQIEGNLLTSSSKAWRGTILETAIPPGPSEGSFTVTISAGLVRLGVCAADSDSDQLGTDLQGFGYGGTGKKSHGGVFEDYGEAFGAGDTLQCRVSRSRSGDLTVSYQKNGVELGKAFEMQADQLAVKNLELYPALCGKAFTVHWMPFEAPLAEPVEWPCQLRYYAMHARKFGQLGGQGKSRVVVPDNDALHDFFGDRARAPRGEGDSMEPVELWLRGSAQGRADLRGSKEVRRVQRSHTLPSGVTLTIIDSQPASKAGADRSYARNVALWEALPRGHAEVKHKETTVCELSGLRKFGSAEEKFGPLARQGHGARLCALQTLPGAMSDSELSELKLVFMTKENGEMCKVSFFQLASPTSPTSPASPYLALGSKNVTLAVTLRSKVEALADLDVYEEERYDFAKEMALVFLDQFFRLSSDQQNSMVTFVAAQKATLCGESINPEHQHIQSYRDDEGMIQAHIRFFSLTTPAAFFPHGLTLVDPMEAARLFGSWGLACVEAIEEVLATDRAAVERMEQKHLLLPNREGAVVYVVLRQKETTRTALVYKWKNAWYVTVRALREKFCKRVSEARIRQRIRLLHVHHPDEKQILEDFLSFYRFVLLLLPEKDFDQLGGLWVALKAAHDAYEAGASGWFKTLPESLVSQWHPQWLDLFPKLHAVLKVHLPESAQWIEVLRARRKLLDIPAEVTDSWVKEAVECLTKDGQVAFPRAIAADSDELTLTAVLVRGLQGSGKSTLCRALAKLTQGEWINQDEVAAGAQRGSNAKELFLKAISAAAAKAQVRYIFIDKIHILKQHRDDVLAAVMQGFSARGAGRVALVLLNLCHPEDEEGDYHEAAELCTQRIQSRGLGHLSLLPQAVDAHSVVCGAAEDAEVLTDEEKCSLDLCSDLDLRLPRLMMLSEALKKLKEGGFLADGVSNDIDSMEEAVKSSQAHELKLSSRWKTLYWMIALDWHFLWEDTSEALRRLLLEALRAMPELVAVNEPHVTLAWLGSEEHPELDEELRKLEGSQVHFSVKSVCYDRSGAGLLALRVNLETPYAELCQNRHPHITVAKGPGVAAKESNDLLQRLAELPSDFSGPSGLVEKVLENALKVTGVVQRQLASESLALATATADTLPEGHPVLPGLGLAATEQAVDVWATHESSIRIRKVERILGSLLCPVSQPLMHCKGWPPALRGKKWFTFHERPLQPSTRAALETLQRNGSFSTLHAAVAYLQLEDWQNLSLETLQQHLVDRLRGPGVKALRAAAAVLEVTGGPCFYVQCKSAGSQEQTLVFRRALAAALSELMDWIPEIKNPHLTLSVHLKDDWMLLGFVFPKAAEARAAKAKTAKGKVVPTAPTLGPNQSAAAAEIPLPEVTEGLLQIDGSTLEGGGQLLRNSAAYAATLQRGISICNVRGGRATPGLRPAHLAALEALAQLSSATLSGATAGSGQVTFEARPGAEAAAGAAVLVVDAGTGGSTMLMLQAILPMLLARSGLEGGRPVEVIFKGGTNVCSPRPFEINAPQVDYVQLVLFPVLRTLFGVTLELQVKQRGFLQGGGEVLVRCSTPLWPLKAAEMVEPGEILEVAGTLYRSAAVPQNVLPRMLEGQLKKRPGGAAVLLKEKLPEVVPHFEFQECPTANGAACGLVLVLRSSTGCHFGGDSMGRKGTMAEAVGEEAARKAWAAYGRGGCCDEHLEDQLVIFMALAKGTSRLRLGTKQSLHFQTALWLAQAFGASLRVVPDVQGEILEIEGIY